MADLAERALIIPLRSFIAAVGFAVVRSEERPEGSDERLLAGEVG